MPSSLPVDASANMNYASVVFAGFAAIATAWYFAYARKNFTGPKAMHQQAEEGVNMEESNVVEKTSS
jgi:hypothetical protein